MYNRTEFLVQLKRSDMTQMKLSEMMGVSLSSLNKKIQTGNFRRNEIARLIELLQIESPERLYEIFFDSDLRRDKKVTQEEL